MTSNGDEKAVLSSPSEKRSTSHDDASGGLVDNLAAEVDPRAVGGTLESMPKRYYLTPSLIGTFCGCCLSSMALYIGFVLPFNILDTINADLGKHSRTLSY
jgi:hypothetical protein